VNANPVTIFLLVAAAAVFLFALYAVEQRFGERVRPATRYVGVIALIGGFFYAMHRGVDDHARAVDITKAAIALVGVACLFYESHRASVRRPVAERWKRFIGVALGVAAITAYFNGFRFGYAKYYHRWDQYHYYMGAKYFKELGYDGLYKCGVIAQDELGTVRYTDDNGRSLQVDLRKEVRSADKKIRNLGGDNLLIDVATSGLLEHHEICTDRFTPERWDRFKADVQFFRIASDKGYWTDMQTDHGYNPPPVWTIMGKFFGELAPASTGYLQFLASLDIFYLAGMFVALWWAFGWRVFAIGAIFWGCQSSAPFYWTGGAFLRQDWLFFLVLSACLIRKRWYKLAGASMVYAGLLRVFPGLAVIGWLAVAGIYLARHKRLAQHHKQVILGGVLAAAVLIPVSLGVAGKDSYQQFFRHTIQVHDQTPLTNHMGLRVLIGHNLNPLAWNSPASGRMKYVKDGKLTDAFKVWKDMRNERYAKYRGVAYAIILASLLAFVWLIRRVKSLWIAQCIGQVFIILLSQLTCYYYSFMILLAPLTRVKRQLEAPLLGFAALTQFVWLSTYWNDDRYTGLTAVSLAFSYGVFAMFWPKSKPHAPIPSPATTPKASHAP
jgi:hypothetical protein